MIEGEHGPEGLPASAVDDLAAADPDRARQAGGPGPIPSILVTEVNPFHCLYQDALEFHSQSRLILARSESASSRLARAALLLYVASAEALVHQAAAELGRPELAKMIADPTRPLPLLDAWRLLPAIVGQARWPGRATRIRPLGPSSPNCWRSGLPGVSGTRRAIVGLTIGRRGSGADFEPLQPHQVQGGVGISADALHFPKTGLPRDPYALRPHHLDAARGILDAAIAALDRRLDGALTRDNRHRREPTRFLDLPGS